jgi:beta-glucosidase
MKFYQRIFNLFLLYFLILPMTIYCKVYDKVEQLLSRMTLEEKIGQMTQVDSSYLKTPDDITKYFIGSVLSGGNSYPYNNESKIKPEDWANYIDELQNYAMKTRLKIPLLYGVDAVHGNQKVYGATIFPHNIGLGCIGNEELLKRIGEVTAIECKAVGVNWTFSPCVAVARDERWGRTYESFSEDPFLVAKLGSAMIVGLQKVNNSDGIAACAKHYLGDGGTVFGTGMKGMIDQGDTIVKSEELARKLYLTPYIYAVSNNVKTIMASFSSLNGIKMHENKKYLTDILKGELKFQGFVVSDWKAIEQLPGDYENQVEKAINAGIDMVMVPDDYIKFITVMKKLVENKKISMSRIDDAVRRILKVKFEIGLFENPYSKRELISRIGSQEHREIARQAVRESMVLLKNDKSILPLKKNLKQIVVVGPKADDLGSQCGGWTISWQGKKGKITEGKTILEGLKEYSGKNTKIIFDKEGKLLSGGKIKDVDVCIMVLGESPYAEFMGDRTIPTLDYEDLSILERVSSLNIPKVLILITGRPLVIPDFTSRADAILVAWLPGTEGMGVIDVLFGEYKPTGKLSFSWPGSEENIPVNVGDKNYKPLFPFGYGLTY